MLSDVMSSTTGKLDQETEPNAMDRLQPAVFATLKFKEPSAKDSVEKPYDIRCIHPDDIPPMNFRGVWVQDIPIYDMRPLLPTLSLDVQGFVVVNMESQLRYEEFFDQQKLKSVFAEELRAYLLDRLGASCIFFHECVIRKRDKSSIKDGVSLHKGYGQPAIRAHGDYTLDEVTKLLAQLGGDKMAEYLKTHRYQALNIWKPLRGPLKDWPLTLCDLRSVGAQDMVPLDEVYADDVLESYQVHYNPKQQWYYLSDQLPTEMFIFKSADSQLPGTVPHCAFRNPLCPKDEPGRESIELRALVLY